MRRQVLFPVVLLVLIGTGAAYGFNPNEDPSLIGLWTFDEGAGTTAFDLSGKGHDGTLMNGPTWTTGYFGGALNLNASGAAGTGTQYVDCGSHADFNLTSQVTLSAWVYPSRAADTTHECYITKGDTSYALKETNTNGNVEFFIYNSGTWTSAQVTGRTASNNNTWYHLAGTYDGANIKIYLNGVLTATTAYTGPIGTNAANVNIGRDADGGGRRYYRGRIDDVRIYNRALTAEEVQALLVSNQASVPVPGNGATDVARDGQTLRWTPAGGAVKHDVYFGTDATAVSDATASSALLVSAGQDPNTLSLARLELGVTYYWRVDEIGADGAAVKGVVWHFTAEPVSIAIPSSQITATASSSAVPTAGPEKTIDGSGLNSSDQHSSNSADMWLSSGAGPEPAWIQYAFKKTYALDKMLVWNSNDTMESGLGFGAKDVTVEYSTDGTAWTALGDFEFAQAPGAPAYEANTTISFGDVAATFVRLTIHSNWGGLMAQKGLSEVRFLAIPAAARLPVPASGATGVSPFPQAALSWRAGRMAGSHDVYVGTDSNAVAEGTAPMATTSSPAYEAPLNLATTYYWKVVEVNTAETPASWDGDVWSFTTADYVVVDDFERYANESPNRVFQTWIDGLGFSPDEFFPKGSDGNGTGSAVGNDPTLGNVMETTVVHGGGKSMPFFYENPTAAGTSETTRTFAPAQDWTSCAIKTLTLYFYGSVDNTGSAPLWVKLTDASNGSAKVTFGDAGEDVTAVADQAWTEWNMPLGSFKGVNLAKIASITIGIGPGVASGRLFIDDIRLYPDRVIPTPAAPVLVGYWKLDNNAQDSSGNGNDGTLTGGPTYDPAGRIGAALSLDGIDDYVNCGNGASLNITDTVTLSVWVSPSDAGNSQHNPFVGKGDTSYAIKHNVTNVLQFFIYDGTWYSVNGPTLAVDFNHNWHHVAGSYDGTQLKLYVDGKCIAATLRKGVIATNTYNVNIGRNSQNTDRLYNGLIDEVRIYHGVLPKSEIVKLANP
jgi:hypothetical protein